MVRPRASSASSSRCEDGTLDFPPAVGRSSAEGPEVLVRSDISVIVGAPAGGRTRQGVIVIKLAPQPGQLPREGRVKRSKHRLPTWTATGSACSGHGAIG